MDRAVGEMLGTASGSLKAKKGLSGTPGQKQLPHVARNDKAFYDGHTGRAEPHDYTPRCAESVRRPRPEPVLVMPPPVERVRLGPALPPPRREWKPGLSALDRAWRATDLLLNTGGFQAVVLDLGDTPAEDAGRVPLATWSRFRLQVEKARALFLLVARSGCAGSCAALSVKLDQAEPDWRRANGASPALLAGVRCRVTIERHRTAAAGGKKPAACAPCSWTSAAPWTR